MPPAHCFYSRAHHRIRDVRAIPREQVVDAVHCCDSHMECINFGFEWQRTVFDECLSQIPGVFGYSKFRNTIDGRKTPGRCLLVTSRSFYHDKCRNIQLKIYPTIISPISRDVLIGSHPYVVARVRC